MVGRRAKKEEGAREEGWAMAALQRTQHRMAAARCHDSNMVKFTLCSTFITGYVDSSRASARTPTAPLNLRAKLAGWDAGLVTDFVQFDL